MISPNQKLAVVALNDGVRIADVAVVCKVSPAQIKRWCEDPQFKKERYMDMSERFGNFAGEALETLHEIMKDKDARGADRLKAATEILNRAGFVVQQQVNFTLSERERSGEFNYSPEELKKLQADLDTVLSMRDITPEEQLQITEDVERDMLVELTEFGEGDEEVAPEGD